MSQSQDPRWRRADELFDRALDLAPSDRPAFVQQECGEDEELRALVEQLLAASEQTTSPLDKTVPASPLAGLWNESKTEDSSLEGQTLGAFQVREEIGRGGMAVVYLGERQDGTFDQQVAIKVLLRGIETDDVLRRFRRERQILAATRHPNIARIIDGGATPDGRPYFVMELVDGQPIDAYCDQHRLTVRQRLELFLEVASAVQDAHRRLVVHRDLKPSNILVTTDGAVKLMDFGIAKLLDAKASGQRTVTRLMTPLYASPEQVRGEPVTTATDVYQLGLLLYLLLTGRPALALTEDPVDLIRAVTRGPVARPSVAVAKAIAEDETGETERRIASRRATSGPGLVRELKGDLETILLKALRKEPERRYQSVAALAGDLEAYFDGRPVSARPDTLAYRTRKFVSRHHLAVSAAALVALVLVAFSVAMGVQAKRLQTERDRANREAQTATVVSGFMTDLFRVSDPEEARGNTITAREILDRGARDIRTRLAATPGLQGRLESTMATVYANLGLYEEAEELAAGAVETLRAAERPDHPDTLAAQAGLADALMHRGNYAASEALALETRATAQSLLGEDHPTTLATQHVLGRIYGELGRFEEAAATHRQEFERREATAGPDHADTLNALDQLADDLTRLGNYGEAEALLREALERRRRVFGADHPATARTIGRLAGLLFATGRHTEAEPLYREAGDLLGKAVGEDHPDYLAVQANLSNVLRYLGRYDEALTVVRDTDEAMARVLGPEHPDRLGTRMGIGLVLVLQERYDEAGEVYEQLLETQRRVLGGEDLATLVTMSNLANLYRHEGRHDDAGAMLADLVERSRRALGADHPSTVINLYNAACHAASIGRSSEALAFLRDAATGGFTHAAIFNDPDLESLRGLSELAEIETLVEGNRQAAGLPPRPPA